MIKKVLSKKWRIAPIVFIICGLILVILLGVASFVSSFNNAEVSKERSDANEELMKEANNKGDVWLCEQISGGIREKKPQPARHEDGVVMEGSLGSPALNESGARAECRKIVQRGIEHQRQLREGLAQ